MKISYRLGRYKNLYSGGTRYASITRSGCDISSATINEEILGCNDISLEDDTVNLSNNSKRLEEYYIEVNRISKDMDLSDRNADFSIDISKRLQVHDFAEAPAVSDSINPSATDSTLPAGAALFDSRYKQLLDSTSSCSSLPTSSYIDHVLYLVGPVKSLERSGSVGIK